MNFLVNTLRQSLPRSLIHLRATLPSNATENKVVQATKSLLQPVTPLLSIVCGFKMKYSVRKRCKDCYFVVRDGRLYNICPTHPRHKVMSLKTHEKKLRILTYACQSKHRPW